jgi:hypothetical protein
VVRGFKTIFAPEKVPEKVPERKSLRKSPSLGDLEPKKASEKMEPKQQKDHFKLKAPDHVLAMMKC